MNAIQDWLRTAQPQAKLGYLIAERKCLGYHVDHDTIAQLAFIAGVTTNMPTLIRVTIAAPPPTFDPTAQCAYPGCTNPIGPYRSGKHPIMCTNHRHANRNKARGQRSLGQARADARHVRWHTNRGITNPNCRWCTP